VSVLGSCTGMIDFSVDVSIYDRNCWFTAPASTETKATSTIAGTVTEKATTGAGVRVRGLVGRLRYSFCGNYDKVD
jgi:hypothetical protein